MASIVKIVVNGSTFYLSPGCTVTRTVTRDIGSEPVPGEKNKLINYGWTTSDVVRIDGTVAVPDFVESSDGYSNISHFDIDLFPNMLKASYGGASNPDKHYLTWGDPAVVDVLEGLVRSLTITQRAGQGELFDFSVTFEVGEVIPK